MSKLHALDPEPAAANVIETLEEALEMARNGELSSVAIALVYRDGCSGAIWSFLHSRVAALGSISRLAHKINLEADQ